MPQSAPGRARALVLFDIDGTLVRKAGPHHGRSLELAIRHVTGIDATMAGIDTAGMLDHDILTCMLQNAGASRRTVREALPAIMHHAQRLYPGLVPSLRDRVCPGVRPALSRLRRAGLPLALVTGNLRQIGWRKVQHAGLKSYFRFGAFAESGLTRADLATRAMRQARAAGLVRRDVPVSLIGDHVNDIQAAKASGARSIAVATGVLPAVELHAAGADLVLPDLRALRLEMLL